MRTILIVGALLAAEAAAAQVGIDAAVDAVTSATSGAAACGYNLSPAVAEAHLKQAGFDRNNPDHAAALNSAYTLNRSVWQMHQNLRKIGDGKARFESQCTEIWLAFGPDGVIRRDLLSKK